MARSVGESVSSVLERIFDSSDCEELYSPSAEDDEESEGAEGSESQGTSVQLERGGAEISDDENSNVEPTKKTQKLLKTPESWKKNKRKRRRNSGKKYTSTTDSLVSVFLHETLRCGLLSSSVCLVNRFHQSKVFKHPVVVPVIVLTECQKREESTF